MMAPCLGGNEGQLREGGILCHCMEQPPPAAGVLHRDCLSSDVTETLQQGLQDCGAKGEGKIKNVVEQERRQILFALLCVCTSFLLL